MYARAPNEHTRTHPGASMFASTTQFPTNKPTPHTQHQRVYGGSWFERVERVTAAIAKRETPGPIPNPEVKPVSADGTATERLWESRTPPDNHCGSGVTFGWPHFCISGSSWTWTTSALVGRQTSTAPCFRVLSTRLRPRWCGLSHPGGTVGTRRC